MTEAEKRPPLTWSIDATNPALAAALRAAWAEVVDPEINLNIVQLGLVREVEINEGAAKIRMILTTPFCPYGPAMMENTRQKAEQALGMPATIDYGEEAWSPSMMDDEAAADWGVMW